MECDFLKWWLVGNDEEVSYFIDGLDLEDLIFADETLIINGIEEPLIYVRYVDVYFDRFMNVYGRCDICGELHPVDDIERCSILLYNHFAYRDVCKTCFESDRVRMMCKDGKYCVTDNDYPICIDTEAFPMDGIGFRKVKFSSVKKGTNRYNLYSQQLSDCLISNDTEEQDRDEYDLPY